MKSRFYRIAGPLITKIQKLFSEDLAKENDFLRQENKILRSKLGQTSAVKRDGPPHFGPFWHAH